MRYARKVIDSLGLYALSDDYCLGVLHCLDLTDAGSAQGCDPPKPNEELDVEDAFVEQDGSTFYVVQGNNGRRLRSFSSKADAEKHVEFLHRKNKPEGSNKGAAAKKKVTAQRKEESEG